jgi:magnesium-transporting ATPase (P-type)
MLFLGFPLPLTSFGILYITLVLDILVVSIVYEKEELDVVIREPSKVKIFVKL